MELEVLHPTSWTCLSAGVAILKTLAHRYE